MTLTPAQLDLKAKAEKAWEKEQRIKLPCYVSVPGSAILDLLRELEGAKTQVALQDHDIHEIPGDVDMAKLERDAALSELSRILAEYEEARAQHDDVFTAPDGREFGTVCAFNHWTMTRDFENRSKEYTDEINRANKAEKELARIREAVTRERLERHVAVAWANIGGLERTLEETIDRRNLNASRFISSGEAAAIVDAIRAAIFPGDDVT